MDLGNYTPRDIHYAAKFSEENLKYRQVKLLIEKMPHIATFLNYKETQADPDTDYYYPPTFAPFAKKIDIEIPKHLCEKMTCNSFVWGENRPCNPSETISYWPNGDTEWRTQCEPACFNLNEKITIDKDKKPVAQSFSLRWNEKLNICEFRLFLERYMADPLTRPDEVRHPPVGFNEIPAPDFVNYSTTWDYNKPYCDKYLDDWDDLEKNCVTSGFWNQFLEAVIGRQLIKCTQEIASNVNDWINPGEKSPLPDTLPPKPTDTPLFLKNPSEWRSDKNINFILPDFNLPLSNVNYTKVKEREVLKVHKIEKRELKEKKTPDYKDLIIKMIEGILESLITTQGWKELAMDYGSDILLGIVKNMLKTMSQKWIPLLFKIMSTSIIKWTSNLLKNAILTATMSVVINLVMKSFSKVMLVMIKLLSAAVSIVSWITGITMAFVTILLEIYDPFSFNGKYPKETLKYLTLANRQAMSQMFQSIDNKFTFFMLSNHVFTDDQVMILNAESILSVAKYLDSLTVNSDGELINKGEYLPEGLPGLSEVIDTAIKATFLYSQIELDAYEHATVQRNMLWQYSLPVGVALTTGIVVSFISKTWILSLILILLLSFLVFVTIINFQFNLVKTAVDLRNRILLDQPVHIVE